MIAVQAGGKTWKNLTLFWAAVIFITSCTVVKPRAFVHAVGNSIPGALTEEGFNSFWHSWWWVFVKGYHVMEFAVLTFLLSRWLMSRTLWLPFLIAAAYAASDEIHQLWVPERGGRVTDWMIDMIGVTLVSCAVALVRRRPRE